VGAHGSEQKVALSEREDGRPVRTAKVRRRRRPDTSRDRR
jgi:hypothetical protein